MGRTDDACVRLIALTKTILDGEGEDGLLAEEEAHLINDICDQQREARIVEAIFRGSSK